MDAMELDDRDYWYYFVTLLEAVTAVGSIVFAFGAFSFWNSQAQIGAVVMTLLALVSLGLAVTLDNSRKIRKLAVSDLK